MYLFLHWLYVASVYPDYMCHMNLIFSQYSLCTMRLFFLQFFYHNKLEYFPFNILVLISLITIIMIHNTLIDRKKIKLQQNTLTIDGVFIVHYYFIYYITEL